MRIYQWLKNWYWLIINRSRLFYDLFTWTTIKTRSLKLCTYSTDVPNQVLDFLENNWLSYIVAWTNEDYIVIHNMWSRVRVFNWKNIYISWSYRIKKIGHEKLFEFDSVAIKYPYYTQFSWIDMYDLISWLEKDNLVLEKDVIKNKPFVSSGGIPLSPLERVIVKQVIMYSKRIYNLSANLDPTQEDMTELDKYNDIDIINVNSLYDLMTIDKNKYIKKIKENVVWKKTRREVINSFKF